jgi:MFS family permease
MTLGRLCGDRLADRWGPLRFVRVSSAAAALGWAVALFLDSVPAALVGLVLLGFGLSSVVPNVFSKASRVGRAGPAIAVVTFCGYGGMLAGPAAIGGLAGAVGLPAALAVNAGLAAAIFLLYGVLTRRPDFPQLRPRVRLDNPRSRKWAVGFADSHLAEARSWPPGAPD